jgi:hypothetical protein
MTEINSFILKAEIEALKTLIQEKERTIELHQHQLDAYRTMVEELLNEKKAAPK